MQYLQIISLYDTFSHGNDRKTSLSGKKLIFYLITDTENLRIAFTNPWCDGTVKWSNITNSGIGTPMEALQECLLIARFKRKLHSLVKFRFLEI